MSYETLNSENTLTESTCQVNLQVFFLEQDGQMIAYCPALDLSTYGESEDDVRTAFDEAVEIFLSDSLQNQSLERSLLKMGWTLMRHNYIPPKNIQPTVILSEYPGSILRAQILSSISLPTID